MPTLVDTHMKTPVPFMDLQASHKPLAAQLSSAIADVTDTSAFIGGSHVTAFEEAWAAYCEVPHAVGVGNGTDAIQLALRGLGIGPGEEVILPANTFIATAEAVLMAGAIPVFCDVDPTTLLMDPVAVDAVLSPRTAAVIAVHLFGHPVDLGALSNYTREQGVALIEDAAQAHGARFDGRPVGSWGDAGCFSFYPGKNLGALGDGGAVVCRDASLAARIRSIADHGRDHDRPGQHLYLGTNSRLDGVQAAALNVKLPHLDRWNAGRQHVVERYASQLAGTEIGVVAAPHRGAVDHLAVVRVPNRDRVRDRLFDAGVATGIHYPVPCHQQAPLRRYASRAMPVVEAAASEILSLPLYPQLSDAAVDRVIEELMSAVDQAQLEM